MEIIEQIKKKINRKKEYYKKYDAGYGEKGLTNNEVALSIYDDLLSFIDSLQNEPSQDAKNDNPFDIPDLKALKQQVTEYVKQHQGDLEFIPTNHPDGNIILTFIYEEDLYEAKEYYVKAVRVNKEGKLQIHYNLRDVNYFLEDLAELDENEWRDIDDDIIYYEQTLMSIAYGLPSHEKICKA